MSKHLATVPMTIIPLVLYLVVAGIFGGVSEGHPEVWGRIAFSVTLLSGGVFTMANEHLILIVGLVCLFFEIWKSTRQTSQEMVDQVFSMLVFIAYLVLFITVSRCSMAVFFLLMLISLIDVIAGFLVSLRTARRSLAVENNLGA